MKQPSVFIFCVSPEFRQTRSRVAAILTRLGYTPVIQEIFGTELGDLRQVLRDKIGACEGLIQIVGQGYGAEPPAVDAGYGRVSYTQFEFLYARAQKKKTWLLFAGDACTRDTPLERLDLPNDPAHPNPADYQAERRALQLNYRDKLRMDGHLYYNATSDADLDFKVERLRDELAELRLAFNVWQSKVFHAFAVGFVLLALIGGSVWWFGYSHHRWIKGISEEVPHITKEKIHAQLLRSVERTRQAALADAQKAKGLEERDRLRQAAEKAYAVTISRIDELTASFAEIEGTARSSEVFDEMTRILAFMRWRVPNNGAELSQALAINIGALGVIYFLSVLALYGIAPARFVAWHEWIANRGIPFSESVSKILAPFLLDTPYCLNAVVRCYRQRAHQLFNKAPEVKTRLKWVPAPLLLGDELLQDFDLPPAKSAEKPYVAGLQEIKARLGKGDERWTISVEGPGGVGKSALAFEIARWASDSRSDYRLAPFPMLPILLESLEQSTDKAKTIDAAAAAQLRSVMNAVKISDPLLQALFSRKRVLVVVDGISEMPTWVGQGAIGQDSGAVNARALVVTSRLPTNLPESLVIRPQGLTLAFLDRVLDGLIAATIERADQLLKEKKQLDGLPRALSELVTDYTERQLLRNEPDIHLAMQLARTTAQVCMGKERSLAARSENRYKSKGVSKEILDNFVTAGLMVRSGEKGDPFYKFALDPIAEQLDANRLVIDIREDQVDQTELDDLTQRWEELPEDFVRTLRRAATRYRKEICASHSAISLKLWPHESDGFGLSEPQIRR